jgi:hypothetical protein
MAGWLALVLFCPTSSWSQSSRPVVLTNFVIESAKHKSNFVPESERRKFELRIAAELARLCQERFGFLKWVAMDSATDIPAPAAKLTLSLKAGSGNFPAISLDYIATISGQAHSAGVVPTDLFGGFDDQLTSDHSRLESKLVEKLHEQFGNDAFRLALHEGLLQHVPLASAVKVREHEVIVPVEFDGFAPSHESILLIEFRASPTGSPVIGFAELVPLGEAQGEVSCLIQKLVSTTVVVHQMGEWDPEIVLLLQPPTVESLKVFMRVYKQGSNPGTEGPLIVRPE